jgi:histidyl-tRNA synthetase
MKIPPVKGTRDFYPPDMAIRNFIVDGWKKVSLRNGFEEYDGPIFEYLKMYQIKSGDEIVEQLFSLTDRGGRDLALSPEITPTLARMVNQQINALPKPIKWFSVPRLLRAERPQKGRLREFFQWNIDIIGVDQPLADAEIIFTTLDYLRGLGLTPKDVKAKISSRKLLAAVLKSYGVPDDKLESLYVVLDKKAKLPAEAFEQMLAEQVPDKDTLDKISVFMRIDSIQELGKLIDSGTEVFAAYNEVKEVLDMMETMGGLTTQVSCTKYMTPLATFGQSAAAADMIISFAISVDHRYPLPEWVWVIACWRYCFAKRDFLIANCRSKNWIFL